MQARKSDASAQRSLQNALTPLDRQRAQAAADAAAQEAEVATRPIARVVRRVDAAHAQTGRNGARRAQASVAFAPRVGRATGADQLRRFVSLS